MRGFYTDWVRAASALSTSAAGSSSLTRRHPVFGTRLPHPVRNSHYLYQASSTYNAISGKTGFFISGRQKCDREEWERINVLGVRAPPQRHTHQLETNLVQDLPVVSLDDMRS